VTGLLLAGIGVCMSFYGPVKVTANGTFLQHVTAPPDSQKNFLVVDSKTDNAAIEAAFDRFTSERKDIGILLINQHVRLISHWQIWTSRLTLFRLQNELDIESIHIRQPSRHYSKFLARIIHMIPKRTAY
jgi:vacuolar-type H+-ATPase subunit F/Vma7